MGKKYTIFAGVLFFFLSSILKVDAQNACSCWQQIDTSFHVVPFVGYAAPYYRNDDGSSPAITLPFNFCFWGQNKTTVYINNNGNVTFGSGYSPFSADTFPNVGVPAMIAPFWADVDTKNGGSYAYIGADVVLYQRTATHLIVQWDSVGYVGPAWCTSHPGGYGDDSLFNTFQLILTDGTDPILPKGNNVEFCYKTMHWTTGAHSPGPCADGGNGFGGDPANVGANEGDGIRSIQIGLFASASATYLGQFPPGPGYDGVYWLDNKSFIFNLCSGTIAPLSSGISPCDTFKVCVGDSVSIPLYFLAPLQGDSVWSNLSPPIASGVNITSNKPGPTDSLTIKIIGSNANIGYHAINLYAYDNQVPSDTTYASFVVEVDSVPKPHLSAVRDTICVGDSSVLTASGGQTYIWSTGATTSSIKVSPPSNHTYTVGVSAGLCVKDTEIQLVVINKPAPTIVAKPDSVCSKDSVLLVAGGGGSYIWSTGQTKDSIWVNPVSTKIYKLYASNGYCSDSTQVSVFVKLKGSSKLTYSKDSACPFQPVTISDSGGTAFHWSNGASTSSITVAPGGSATYTVYSTVLCAVDTLIQKITVVPLPTLAINGTLNKCKGFTDTLTASGGTTYKWSNGSTTTNYITGTINSDSTISVVAYNALNCSDTEKFTIHVLPLPVVSIIDTNTCLNSPVVIYANASGGAPYTYFWSPGRETNSSITVRDTDKTYTVTVTNGCTASKSVTLKPDVPTMTACCDKLILLGDDTVITANGITTKPFTWDPAVNCLNPPLCNSVQVAPTTTTTYTVTMTDSLGCQVEQLVTITVEIPCTNFTVPNVFTPTFAGPYGENNIFYIKTENLNAWSIVIFDRWGKEMYNSSNPNQYWDGKTEGGGEAPAGVYYYIIDATCQGNTYKKQGFVQLIR